MAFEEDDYESGELNDVEEAPASSGEEQNAGLRQRRPTTTFTEFFDLNDIDKSTQELFWEYDKNGDGSFSKKDVLCIVADLKKQFHKNESLASSNLLLKRLLFGAIVFFLLLVASIFGLSFAADLKKQFHKNESLASSNLLLKRLLFGAIVFFLLLVASIFGLSFAVATLTRETIVDTSSGTLYNKDGTMAVATDSRAELFQATSFDFGDCLSMSEVETIKTHVLEGKNVMVERSSETDHQLEFLSPSGAIYDDETGVACFPMPEKGGLLYCLHPDGACNDPENGHRVLAAGGQCKGNGNNKNCATGTLCDPNSCDISSCGENTYCEPDPNGCSCPPGSCCPSSDLVCDADCSSNCYACMPECLLTCPDGACCSEDNSQACSFT
eukprot:CAMPEP_0178812710 /NCGR_PEP_ID=MMETSP0745-20121128/19977_1 /TAXON_ID=913974 /ORGANISM="Nitzschia punctata, Strain CCMP561" /LENGTH=383 /DNA_ID=CAMNT_0020473533 /DNA_START=42 /DNA_END=1190 /DNA_ORIENTATION=+